ncbi:MAG: nuclear transport factor 2 family protein [Methanoregula sp.]|nr:nuclear transport factor 2 family protein [Methanoregula sp.]
MDQTTEIHLIEKTIREMNRCWTETWDETQFREYIHPDAVAIVPTSPGCLEGRDAYVAGWKGFVESVTINSWTESDLRIRLHASGSSAVVTYQFTISFSMGGQPVTMKGRDMFFLVRDAGRWLVVADQFSPEPPVV